MATQSAHFSVGGADSPQSPMAWSPKNDEQRGSDRAVARQRMRELCDQRDGLRSLLR